jgi:hypothetical protein
MSSYRNNGAAPKRKGTDGPTPNPKRPKLSSAEIDKIAIDLTQPDTQPIEDPDAVAVYDAEASKVRAAVDRNLAAKNAAATAPFPAPEDSLEPLPDLPYTGWRPRVGPAEVNFEFDHTGKALPAVNEPNDWTYSQSLKGWCRYPCIACGSSLDKDEVQVLLDHRTAIPAALARDTRNPPEYKMRVAPFCSSCRTDATRHLRANPQAYNGRGVAVWVVPC